MSRYVDGFILPVPKRKLAAYRRMAQTAGKVWPFPFDARRMFWGGFNVLVDA